MSQPSSKPPLDKNLASKQPGPETDGAATEEEEVEGISHRFVLFQVMPSWLTSFIFHIAIIIILALIPILLRQERSVDLFSGETTGQVEDGDDISFDSIEISTDELENTTDDSVVESDFTEVIEDTAFSEMADNELDAKIEMTEIGDFGPITGDPTAMKSNVASRSAANRKQMAKARGGSDASERAVDLGLKWLARHQMKDGGWSFDHTRAGPDRTSPNPGQMTEARFAATGMALMCFLGAGQTHLQGDYQETVKNGLAFLIKNQKATSNGGGSFFESQGSLYSHGLATIAIAEAWSMTRDKKLRVPAQAAINYTVNSQDPGGGGWRYRPLQAGDTSVVGWQIMGLKSASMANLRVPERTILGSQKFLDSVQEESGAYYGYMRPERRRYAMTAVGLLCRMYLGWKHEHPGLIRGVEYLDEVGPKIDTRSNMYYNYYATQVMIHYGGKEWKTWNGIMRDYLVKSQDQKGQKEGSWFFTDDAHRSMGGRLYCTCMSIMTLEVYYRYMPLYGDKAQKEDFKFSP